MFCFSLREGEITLQNSAVLATILENQENHFPDQTSGFTLFIVFLSRVSVLTRDIDMVILSARLLRSVSIETA